ncbi:MAG: tail fiber domain-containing protein [Bacteroidales bacterium]|nr:tail fiber domain-containing protein [Bacteroidales bacterium]
MRKNVFLVGIFMCALLLSQSILNAQVFRVTSGGTVQIGYDVYSSLSFGICNCNDPQYNPGEWAIDYYSGGLNFWKPWPSNNSGNYKLFLKDNGNIGIGTNSPSYKFTVLGNIASYGTVIISSDRRLKSEVRPLQSAMDKLSQLNGVSYKKHLPDLHLNEIDTQGITDETKLNTIRNDQSNRGELEQNENYGFIAQELREVFPELVREDNDGYLGIDYISLIPVMVEAMKELREEIDMLKSANEDFELRDKNALENNNGMENSIQGATLYQNAPNPFSSETEIRYYIPNNTGQASMLIFDMQGTLKKQMQITGKGNGSLTINASELPAGMYIYSLIVDGNEIDSKRMILTK